VDALEKQLENQKNMQQFLRFRNFMLAAAIITRLQNFNFENV